MIRQYSYAIRKYLSFIAPSTQYYFYYSSMIEPINSNCTSSFPWLFKAFLCFHSKPLLSIFMILLHFSPKFLLFSLLSLLLSFLFIFTFIFLVVIVKMSNRPKSLDTITNSRKRYSFLLSFNQLYRYRYLNFAERLTTIKLDVLQTMRSDSGRSEAVWSLLSLFLLFIIYSSCPIMLPTSTPSWIELWPNSISLKILENSMMTYFFSFIITIL